MLTKKAWINIITPRGAFEFNMTKEELDEKMNLIKHLINTDGGYIQLVSSKYQATVFSGDIIKESVIQFGEI
jgi:hypothetical protein